MLLSSFGTSSANVGLPAIARAFGADFADVQWIVLAYLVTLTALVVGAGKLGDILGRRRLLVGGLWLFVGASLLCGFSPSVQALVGARALQGAAAAIMMALTFALVGEAVPRDKTGQAMGLLATMSAVGTALGPSLGGFLIAAAGWRAIFWVNVPLGLLALFLAGRFLPATVPGRQGKIVEFDFAGTLLLGAVLAAYALAVTIGRGNFGVWNGVLLAAAATGATGFVFLQRTVRAPLLNLSRFRERLFATSLAMNGLVATIMMTTLVVGPFYLAGGLGLDAPQTGLALALGPVIAALVGTPAGMLVDRFGVARSTIAGLGGIVSGSILLSVLPRAAGVGGYLGPIAVITAGYGLFQAAINTGIMTGVEPGERGVVSGLLNLSRNLGLVTGAAVMGAVFALSSGTDNLAAASPQSIALGTRITFAAAALIGAGAMTMAWTLTKQVSRHT